MVAMFLLVEFTDNTELAVIPDNWLEGTSCAVWPPCKSTTRLTKSVINKEPPLESWRAFPIRVLYKHESYEKVRGKLKQAELDSDLQTTDQQSQPQNKETSRPVRRKRSPSRYTSSSDEEEALPRITKKTKNTTDGSKKQNPPATANISISTVSSPLTPSLPTPPVRLLRTVPSPVSLTQTVTSPVYVMESSQSTSSFDSTQGTQNSLLSIVPNLPTIPELSSSVPITTYTHGGSTACPINPADTPSNRTSSRPPTPRTLSSPRSPATYTHVGSTSCPINPADTPSSRTSSRPPTPRTLSSPRSSATYTHVGSTSFPINPADTPSSRTSSRPPTPRNLSSPRSPAGSISAKGVQLFTILEQMRAEQRHISSMVSAILAKVGDGATVDEDLPEDIQFPLQTKEEVQTFEEKIQAIGLEKLIISHLASVGGSSVENMGERILKYMVANPLVEQYNWTGSKSKAKFGVLRIPTLVKRAIRRSFREVTDAKVQDICRIFLKSARDRDGGRKRRMDKNQHTMLPDPADTAPVDNEHSESLSD